MDKRFLGRWTKVAGAEAAATQSPDLYPDTLEIREGGLYEGKATSPRFLLWDVGVFEPIDATHVRVSLANDARRPFAFRFIDDGTLEFTDGDGRRFSYRRD